MVRTAGGRQDPEAIVDAEQPVLSLPASRRSTTTQSVGQMLAACWAGHRAPSPIRWNWLTGVAKITARSMAALQTAK